MVKYSCKPAEISHEYLFTLHKIFFLLGGCYLHMRISFNVLLKKLEPYDPELYLSNENYKLLSGVRLLEENQEIFESHYIYISKLSDVQNFTFKDGVINLLCIDDKTTAGEYTKITNLNLLILRKDISLMSLLNKLLDFFSNNQEYSKQLTKLLDAFTHPKDIDHILNIGYEVIGNPICVIDTTFKLLSYTRNVKADDPFWNELIQTGYFSSKSVFSFKNERTIEKIVKSRSPVLFLANKSINRKDFEEMNDVHINGHSFQHSCIVSNVFIGNKIVAYLTVLEYNRNFESYDVETVEILCSAVSSEMQKNNFFTKTRGMMYEYFIADLLSGNIADNKVVEERIKYLDWNIKRNFCVIVISTKQFDRENTPFSYVRIMFESIIIDSRSIEYDDHIILIVNSNRDIPLRETEVKTLKEFLFKHNLYGGISRCFTQIIDMEKYYKQALAAIKIGYRVDNKTHLYYYESLIVFDLIDTWSTQKSLKDLCHPSLISLVEYDQKYKTDYVQTLYAYIENDKSQAATAKTLNMHRNTISYRMTKINEIMKVDYNDTMVSLHLHLSFKILDYMKLDNNESNQLQIPYPTKNPSRS